MKRFGFYHWFALSFFVLLAALLARNSYSYLDPDFGWHLRVGQDIVKSRQVPQVDVYDYTLAGQPWVDHEWLFNAGLYGLYQIGGYGAVTALFVGIVLAVLWLLWRYRFSGLEFDAGWFVLLSTLGLLAMMPHLGVRLQEVTLLGLVLELIILDRCRRQGKTAPLAWLLPLFFLWANLHAGFLIGLVILWWWPVLEAARRLARRWRDRLFFVDLDQIMPWTGIGRLVGWATAATAATFATPYGYKLYGFLASFGNSYYLLRLQEWLPFYYWPVKPLYLVYLGLTAATLILLFSRAWGVRDRRLDLWWLSLTVLFLLMALKSRRHLPLLVVASLPYLVSLLSTHLTPWSAVFERLAPHRRRLKVLGLLVLWITTAVLVIKTRFVADPFAGYCESYPCRAVAELKAGRADGPVRIFNNYGWGGYLLWQWPELPLFIDGRQPQQWCGELSLLEEYDRFFQKDQAALRLAEHRIDLALLKKTRKVEVTWFDRLFFDINEASTASRNDNLIEHLKASPEWRLCHEDQASLAFCRLAD